MPKKPAKAQKRDDVPQKVNIPKELHDLKKLSRDLFEAKVNELFFITREELIAKIKDPKASVVDLWLTKLVIEGTKTGDLKALQFLLDRIIGPINSGVYTATRIEGHMSWVQYIEDRGIDDFAESK